MRYVHGVNEYLSIQAKCTARLVVLLLWTAGRKAQDWSSGLASRRQDPANQEESMGTVSLACIDCDITAIVARHFDARDWVKLRSRGPCQWSRSETRRGLTLNRYELQAKKKSPGAFAKTAGVRSYLKTKHL